MFRIRTILDDTTPANQAAIRQAQDILRSRFAGSPASDIDRLSERLRDPFAHGLRTILLVGEDAHDHVKGCAVLLHAPDLAFCFLEFLAASLAGAGQGIGGALYERVRE
jgi:hypothetical protein